jgi:hypothetical protein
MQVEWYFPATGKPTGRENPYAEYVSRRGASSINTTKGPWAVRDFMTATCVNRQPEPWLLTFIKVRLSPHFVPATQLVARRVSKRLVQQHRLTYAYPQGTLVWPLSKHIFDVDASLIY